MCCFYATQLQYWFCCITIHIQLLKIMTASAPRTRSSNAWPCFCCKHLIALVTCFCYVIILLVAVSVLMVTQRSCVLWMLYHCLRELLRFVCHCWMDMSLIGWQCLCDLWIGFASFSAESDMGCQWDLNKFLMNLVWFLIHIWWRRWYYVGSYIPPLLYFCHVNFA